ncbi:endonuclease [Marinilabiliaceae bacterium JC017]|nr:endonuclease [Marinilabiliaceae bacterium JC017]
MAEHNRLGEKGEDIAAEFLADKGYRILARNWRFKQKEIDLIAQKDDFLVIAEVRTRSTDGWENPKDSITNAKIRFLVDATEAYIIGNDVELEVRFDVITLIPRGKGWKIEHIEEAFHPQL